MRTALGNLWLGWYVHRSDARRPFSGIERTTDDARQLRVRDVIDDPLAWEAMSVPDPNAPSDSHVGGIAHLHDRRRPDAVIERTRAKIGRSGQGRSCKPNTHPTLA